MNIYHKYIDRVTITGSVSDRNKAHAYLDARGYVVRSSGPKPLRFPMVDTSHFIIVADKEIKK